MLRRTELFGAAFGEATEVFYDPNALEGEDAEHSHDEARFFIIGYSASRLLFVDRDLAYELLWNFVRTLSARLRETNDKMTFLSVTNKF